MGICIALLILVKENGVLFAFPLIIFTLISLMGKKNQKYVRLIVPSLLILPFVFTYFITQSPMVASSERVIVNLARFSVLGFFAIIFSSIPWIDIAKTSFFEREKSIFYIFLPLLIPIGVLSRNMIVFGTPYLALNAPFVNTLMQNGILTPAFPPNPLSYFLVHQQVINELFVGSMLVPLIVSLYFIVRERKVKTYIVFSIFMFYILIVAAFYNNDVEGDSMRHLVPLIPSLAILISMGVSKISKATVNLQVKPEYLLLISSGLYWIMLISKYNLLGSDYLRFLALIANNSKFSMTNILEMLGAWLPPLLLVFKGRASGKVLLIGIIAPVLLLLNILLSLSTFIWSPHIVNEVNQETLSFAYPYADVFLYLKNTLSSNYNVTIAGFGLGPLIYFLPNYTYIELANPVTLVHQLNLLKGDVGTTLNNLASSEVYFLIPITKTDFRYNWLITLSNSSSLLNILMTEQFPEEIGASTYYIKSIKFSYFKLSKIMKFQPRQTYDNITWSLKLVDAGTINVTFYDAVIETFSGMHSRFYLKYQFVTLQDWSSFEAICVLWYGNSTYSQMRFMIDLPNLDNRIGWSFTDDFSGWKLLTFPFSNPDIAIGAFDLSKVSAVYIVQDSANVFGRWRVGPIYLIKSIP
ncbi:MAG: hypothetical protein QXR45_08385 [Candidatus Bathyarchaeia archaeon]